MIKTLRKLNGWQRLWVLASVVWLLLVGYYTYANYPRGPSFADVGRASCIFSDLYGKDAKRAIEKVLPNLASLEEGSPKTCKDLFQKIAQSGRANEVQQVYEQYLRESRLAFFARTIAYWAIPVVLVYLFGMGAAWVIRGFGRST